MKQANDVITWIETKVQNTPILFTADKFEVGTLPEGFHSYDIGFNDENFRYEILAKCIKRNVIAKVICFKALNLDNDGLYRLRDTDLNMNSISKFTDFDDYCEKYKIMC